ncbi:PAS domain S-box-containing protein [Rhizobium sp. PP-CC-3A-592]|nr:PAS domain S-box-containing protein [Rhizobium sp. PP-CC-3A-592]
MQDPSEEQRIDREIHSTQSGADPFAAAMRATRMPMVITDPRLPDNPIVFVNDAFARMTGYSREETLGHNCRFLQGPGTNLDDVEKVRQAIRNRVPIEIDLLNYRKDGSLFWNRLLVSPVFDGGELTYYFASQLDVTRERTAGYPADRDVLEQGMQQRIADLTASEQRLHFTLKAGGLGTWTFDVPNQRLVSSALCKANFGRGAAETLTFTELQEIVYPEDFQRWKDTLNAALATDGNFHIEYRVFWPDGSLHWVEIRAETRFDDDGAPLLMSGISIDITARREDEAYRDLMNREMGHRIKNILATVGSIVSQSLRTEAPASNMRDTVAERIRALSAAHDILTGKEWDVAGLRQVVTQAVQPFNAEGRIRITGADLDISRRASSALTLALHELSTNAVKYGSLSADSGSVSVVWSVSGETFELTWQETGGPPVRVPALSGFGSRMIEKALTSSVSGEARIHYHPEGVMFRLMTTTAEMRTSGREN